jgi:hypothetical protein
MRICSHLHNSLPGMGRPQSSSPLGYAYSVFCLINSFIQLLPFNTFASGAFDVGRTFAVRMLRYLGNLYVIDICV